MVSHIPMTDEEKYRSALILSQRATNFNPVLTPIATMSGPPAIVRCLGTKSWVQVRIQQCFASPAYRAAKARSHCCREMQVLAATLAVPSPDAHQGLLHIDFIGASV